MRRKASLHVTDFRDDRFDAAATVRPMVFAPTAGRQATSVSSSLFLQADPLPLCPSQQSPAVLLQAPLCTVPLANHWGQARHLGLEERFHRTLPRDIHLRGTVLSRLEARTTRLPPRT